MIDKNETKSRRQFIQHGLRAAVVSGLALMGWSLGRRKASPSAEKTSCPVDLPCRVCSELPGCQQAEALETKREYHGPADRYLSKEGGLG